MSDPLSSTSANPDRSSARADLSDEHLMIDFARGSPEAFQVLFHRYNQQLFAFFSRRVVNRSSAEELAQETFIAIVRAARRYEVTALFRTWLYAIAYKVLRSFRRRSFFRAAFDSSSGNSANEPFSMPSIEIAIFMRQAIRKLDPVDREVLLLREFEQLSYAEIAALLHLPLNTVRSRLFRARSALRDVLQQSPASTVAPNLAITKEQA